MKFKAMLELSAAFTLAALLLFMSTLALFQIPAPALAASALPQRAGQATALTITPTKQANPGPIVGVGQVVTYTIVFSADNNPGTVLITDVVPLSTAYHTGSMTATGSTGVNIFTAIVNNLLVWTATNVTTGSLVTARFVVTVSQGAALGVPIANTAWLTDGTKLYSTTTTITTTNPAITLTKTASKDTVTVGQPVTYIYHITNTGNVTLAIQLVDDKLGPLVPAKTTLGPDEDTTADKIYIVQASDLPGPLTNTATVTGTPTVGNDNPISAEAYALVSVEELAVYLPIIVKPEPVNLTVIASNTNGITSLKIGPYFCTPPTIADGSSKPCPLFPPGNYDVVAMTNKCGTLTASLPFISGADTLNIFCN